MYNIVAGAFDRKKHTSIENCIQLELSEEARLTGGKKQIAMVNERQD